MATDPDPLAAAPSPESASSSDGDLSPDTASSADTVFGTFSDDGPWTVDPEHLPWRRGLAGVRTRLTASLPQLTRRRRLPPLHRLGTTVRAVAPALGLWYVKERRRGGSESVAGISRRLRVAAERLGPTYIKLGQIVASGDGVFPPELVAEFKWCRDQVTPESWAVVEQVLTEELGGPLSATFATVERAPLAAASIAQVHAATLLDGTPVVVKVQRPTVSDRVRQDLAVMAWLAPLLVGRIPVSALANPPALVELFAETIVEELDFRLEAENMLDVATTFAALDQRDFVVPRPHPTLVTRRMLVMERLDGFHFGDVEGMQAAGIDTEAVVRAGMIGFLEGALFYGIFHGDLHGGNLFVLPSGKTALLDFGITGRLTEAKRLALLALVVGASNADIPAQVAALRDLGAFPAELDVQHVIDVLGLDRPPIDPTALTADELVAEMQHSIKTLLGIGAHLPKELMLFVKNLMFLDGAIATLAPDLDLFAEVEAIALLFAAKHGERIMAQLGLQAEEDWAPDITGIKAGFGLDASTEAPDPPGDPGPAGPGPPEVRRPGPARPPRTAPDEPAGPRSSPIPAPAGARCKAAGMATIRELRNDDWEGWSALWAGYLAFYRAELDDLTTQSTFERLCAGEDGMFGLLALDDAGKAIGMANCVVHASTWSRQPKCYLEDLFVDPAARGSDVGRALLRGGQGGRDRAGGRHGLLAHPAVQRPGPLPLRPGRAADVVRRLRDVVGRRPSQRFRRVSPMPRALLWIPAPSRARR